MSKRGDQRVALWVFISKELKSIARDPKMLIAMLVIPLILMAILYAIVGHGVAQQVQQAVRESGIVAVLDMDRGNYSRVFIEYLKNIGLVVRLVEVDGEPDVREVIRNLDSKILYVVPKGFSLNLSRFEQAKVYTYVRIESLTIGEGGIVEVANRYVGIFNRYLLASIAREKGIPESLVQGAVLGYTRGLLAENVIENPEKVFAIITMGGFLVPLIMLVLVLFAAQLIATSIAIEKEEKMFETLLSLPINRMSIIGAKLVVSLLISILYMVIYSFMLLGFLFGQIFGSINAQGVSVSYSDMLISALPSNVAPCVFVNVIGLTLFMVFTSLLLSLFAEDVRTAQAIIGNVIGPTVVVVYMPMFIDVSTQSIRIAVSLIPIANTVFLPKLAVVQDTTSLILASVSNIIYALIVFLVVRRIVNSETIFTLKLFRRKKRES